MCPTHPETPSHLLPHPIPLGCPRALALGALLHTSNLRWPSILHMVTYTFQCYSLKSSHSCLLAHSPEVCSLHLCLFCCFAYRVVVTVFLYFNTHTRTHTHTYTCINILYWCFSFGCTSFCICIRSSSFILLIGTDSNVFLFIAE